jgi:hypothetical protein
MDHNNVCDHQAFIWQHHQHVAALQGCSPHACPEALHVRLHGGRDPSSTNDAAPSSAEQIVAHCHTQMTMIAWARVVMKFPFRAFHPILLWFCVLVMFFFGTLCFLVRPPLPILLITLVLTRRLVADTLLGVININ